MEFVDQPPKEWLEKIGIREEQRDAYMARAAEENTKTPDAVMFSMAEAGRAKTVELDYRSGTVKGADAI